MSSLFDDDLLPCPFCGGKAEFNYTPWDEDMQTGDDGTGWVCCETCPAQMEGITRDEAVEAWNKRIK